MKKILVALCLVMLLVLVGCETPVEEKVEYTVVFYDEDGNVLKEEKVEEGKAATAPVAPEKEGYTFTGWDEDVSIVMNDIETYPMYEVLKYTVTFKDEDGTVLKESVTEYGKTAINPSNPTKKGYKFTGWDKEYTNVKEDLVVTATYELQTYTITYKDEDGQVIEGLEPSSYTILDDASIELPEPPEKEGYECIGWHEDGVMLRTFFSSEAENKIFTLKYKELPKPMELPTDGTFMFENIKKIKHSTLDAYVYQPDFTGLTVQTGASNWEWSSLHPDIVTISQFSTITIASSGYAIIKAVNIANPSIIGYAVVKVTADGVFISSIEEANTKVEYEVTFTDENGTVIETQKVEEGKAANLPTPPAKEGYTFYGWSADHFNITENITLEPTYIEGKSDFAGKTISILGDSGSTYKGYVPEGYSCFYPTATADFGDVNQTWWMQTINKLGMKFLKNNSWGGTCVAGSSNSATSSDVRLKEIMLGKQAPDVLIIFMGANDCGSNFAINTFGSAYKLMLDKIKVLCPNTEIYLMTLPSTGLYEDSAKEEFSEVIRKYAKEYNYGLIDIATLYTKAEYKNYVLDSAHPNLEGMTMFAETAVKSMLEFKGVSVPTE